MSRARAAAVALLVLAVPLATLEASSASPAEAIRPGDPLVRADGDPYCTLSYVFDDSSGEVYLSTASHCVAVGDVVHTRGHPSFGTVAFQSPPGDERTDYALIRVHEDLREHVEAGVRGHPEAPTGVAHPADTIVGDRVHTSGWGIAAQASQTTRENRTGILVDHEEDRVRAETTDSPGDSGAPWTHESGLALGIVSRVAVTSSGDTEEVPVPVPHAFAGYEGPTVAALLEDARSTGFDVTLRTAS